MKENLKGWIEGKYDEDGVPVTPEAEFVWFMHDRFFSHPKPNCSHWVVTSVATANAYAENQGFTRLRWFWRPMENPPEEPDIPRYHSNGERVRTYEEMQEESEE
jgi:hypothetical protein